MEVSEISHEVEVDRIFSRCMRDCAPVMKMGV